MTSVGEEVRFPAPAACEPYAAEVADFVRAVRGQPSMGASGGDGAAVVALLETAAAAGVRMRRASATSPGPGSPARRPGGSEG